MALPVIAGALRISIGGVVAGGGRWSNTWHALISTAGSWDLATITGFHDIFKQFYVGPNLAAGASISTLVVPATTFQDVNYTPLDGSSGAYTFPLTVAGSAVGQAMPAEVAEVVTLRTALRGRQNRGRVYLPAFEQGFFDNAGHLDVGLPAVVTAQLEAVMSALSTNGADLAVGSYGPYKNPVTHLLEAGTPHVTVISSVTMDNLADVQRHRKS